ncbi:MAG: hypothetical protein OXG95_06300 [Chloroflexi bacterium]|nr:hypothetical protein [Chloroflexota bacterium]
MIQLFRSRNGASRAALGSLLAGALALAFACGGGDDATEPDAPAAATTAPATTQAAAPATATAEATGDTSTGTTGGLQPRAMAAGDAGFDSGYPRYVDEEAGLTVVVGTPDLGVGSQRVAFVMSDDLGLVKLPIVSVTAQFQDDAEPGDPAIARYYDFPEGIRGLHVTQLDFDRAGQWLLDVSYPLPDGSTGGTSFPVQVAEKTHAPDVGDAVPASANRTLADVATVYELSTGAEPDPELYQQTIAEALAEGRPLVVVFASPGFCTNALCGPQAEVLSILRERYADDANFIHVDLYENPEEIRTQGLDIAVETPLLMEWGLETAEWTFIIDADGIVTHRFEAFVAESELEPALLEVIESS